MKFDNVYRILTLPLLSLALQVPIRTAQAQAAASLAGLPELEQVTITATRIEGLESFKAPTPAVVVTSEDFEMRAAVTVTDVLNTLPQFRPFGQNIGATFAGTQVLNLRNLSTGLAGGRTLLLVDGHRVVGTNFATGVDANLIPGFLVERVEVVTGGASAAWGSDAVAGVVNVILKDKQNGFSGNVQYGQSRYADTRTVGLSGAWGTGFKGDRGQFMVAAEYSELTDPARVGDRPWGRHQRAFMTKNIDGLIYQFVPASGLTLFNFTPGGVVTGASTTLAVSGNVPPVLAAVLGSAATNNATAFGTGGVPSLLDRSLDPPNALGNVPAPQGGVLVSGSYNPNFAVGGYGSWAADRTMLATANRRSNIFLRTTYEFSAGLDGWVEAGFNQTGNTSDRPETFLPGGSLAAVTVARSNPYLMATGLLNNSALNNVQAFTISRYSPDLGTSRVLEESQVVRLALGLNGDLGGSWSWKSYVTTGQSEDHIEVPDSVIQTRFHAATNVVTSNGAPACNTALTIPGTGEKSAYGWLTADERAACVPANPFGPNSFTQVVRDFVNGTFDQAIMNRQVTTGLSFQGQPLSLPAGPVVFVAGAEYRKEYTRTITDPTANLPPRTVEFGIYEPGGYGSFNIKSHEGDYSVGELFAEAELPLTRDLKYFGTADLNAAIRRTDYSTSGLVTSWKLGLTFQPVKGLLFRGTRSRDIRAANLVELYGVGGQGSVNVIGNSALQDPLQPAANYSYIVNVSGNAALTPELAVTNTIGVTFSPDFMNDLSTSLDYFEIAIEDSIGFLLAQNIVNFCGDGTVTTGDGSTVPAGQPSSPYACSLIVRAGGPNTATNIVTVYDRQVNIGLRDLRGIDAEIRYRFALSRIWQPLRGSLDLRALGTRINYDSTTNIAGSAVGPDVTGVFPNSRWRWMVATTYSIGPLSLNLQGLYNSATRKAQTPGVPSATSVVNNTFYGDSGDVASSWYFNASAQYTLPKSIADGRLQLYFSINNVTNKEPQTFGGGATVTNINQGIGGDMFGQMFVLGLRYTH